MDPLPVRADCGKRVFWIRRGFSPDKVFAFLSAINFDGDGSCWRWGGGVRRGSYGVFTFKSKQISAYRFAYALFIGDPPAGKDLHHVIEEPINCIGGMCCNPWHLLPVSPVEHLRLHGKRARQKTYAGYRMRLLGLCKKGHKLTPYEYPDGHVTKRCLACRAIAQRAKRESYRKANPLPTPDRSKCVHGHELTPENTYEHGGTKSCKICRNERVSRWYKDHPRPKSIAQPSERTHCPNGHPYDEQNTQIVNRGNGKTFRRCAECAKLVARKRYTPAKDRTSCRRGHPYTPDSIKYDASGAIRCQVCQNLGTESRLAKLRAKQQCQPPTN